MHDLLLVLFPGIDTTSCGGPAVNIVIVHAATKPAKTKITTDSMDSYFTFAHSADVFVTKYFFFHNTRTSPLYGHKTTHYNMSVWLCLLTKFLLLFLAIFLKPVLFVAFPLFPYFVNL